MRLSSDNLLYHLAQQWMDTLLLHRPTSSNSSKKHQHQIDDDVEMIKDDIDHALILRNRKRKNNTTSDSPSPTKRGKYRKRIYYFTDPSTGNRSIMTYKHSVWWQTYILHPQPDYPRWAKVFRSRFRMPYESFIDLFEQCQCSEYFEQWSGTVVHKYNKKKPTSLKLLILCVLRYLGRGWTIDDLEEVTVINPETIRIFIHRFIEFGSDTLYNKYVKTPATLDEIIDCASEYAMAGLPGSIGSTDATHIVLENCIYRLRQLHLGFKLTHTARTYNLTVNHRRRILSSTSGHPATFNDKTLITYDDFCDSIKNGIYDDLYEFEMYDYDKEGNVIKMKYRGC